MEELIIKYFGNTLNKSEYKILSDLLRNPVNKKLFKKKIREQYDISYALRNKEIDKEFNEMLLKLKQSGAKTKTRKLVWFQAAAVFVGLIAVSYFYVFMNEGGIKELELDKEAITLTLEDGTVKIITKEGNEKIIDDNGIVVGTQEGNKLEYSSQEKYKDKDSESEVLVYNELYIPYGQTFELVLSDGTDIHLNAGTTLKYPINFIKNQPRIVYLNGEALLEVTKSKTVPFTVHTSEINVRVLGTKFNINAYEEDKVIQTVLVEGSVGLYKNAVEFNIDNATLLKPQHLASWNKEDKDMKINEVDVTEYTAWAEGRLLFKVRPFSEIIKVLERHYDVAITNNYKKLNTQRFFAKFDTETIEEILVSFQQSEAFDYKIINNKIIINPPKQ